MCNQSEKAAYQFKKEKELIQAFNQYWNKMLKKYLIKNFATMNDCSYWGVTKNNSFDLFNNWIVTTNLKFRSLVMPHTIAFDPLFNFGEHNMSKLYSYITKTEHLVHESVPSSLRFTLIEMFKDENVMQSEFDNIDDWESFKVWNLKFEFL